MPTLGTQSGWGEALLALLPRGSLLSMGGHSLAGLRLSHTGSCP